MTKLMHIKVENSACYGVALLNHVAQYNDRQEVLSGDVSRHTGVELFNCPNIVVEVMKQLRLFRGVEHTMLHQVQKHEELAVPPAVPPLPPHSPCPTPVVVPEDLQQDPQLVGAEGHALGEKTSLWEQDDAISELSTPTELAPPEPPQLDTSVPQVQDDVKCPKDKVLVPERPKALLAPPFTASPHFQKPQSDQSFKLVWRQQWPGCL